MNNTKTFLTAVGLLALGATAFTTDAEAKKDKEKCYGVVKAGKNDCGNAQGTHSCAGQAKKDGDGGEWVYLPKGACERVIGGSITPTV